MLRVSTLRATRALPVAVLASAAAVVPVALFAVAAGHMVMLPAAFHLTVVTAAGMLALVAGAALSCIGARRHDGRAVLLGTAFTVMAAMLVLHALATPGVLVGMNGVVQVAGVLNLPVGALVLACSALPGLRRPKEVRRLLALQAAAVAGVAATGAAALAHPELVPALPASGSDPAHLVFAVGAAALGVLLWRASCTYLLTRRPSDLLVAAGVVWLIGAEFGLLHFGAMDAAFWAAHGLEVAGMGLLGIPAAFDLRHGVASRPLVGDLQAADLVAHEEAFLGARVRSLMVRLAAKDPSTEGHTRRVATLAVALGTRLGLSERRLRQLAVGGLLHDMGKLAVPDEILNKPGRLTEEEFAVIRRHPGWGRELLAELGGFSELVLTLVAAHHERLDGGGYPHGRRPGSCRSRCAS